MTNDPEPCYSAATDTESEVYAWYAANLVESFDRLVRVVRHNPIGWQRILASLERTLPPDKWADVRRFITADPEDLAAAALPESVVRCLPPSTMSAGNNQIWRLYRTRDEALAALEAANGVPLPKADT